MSRQTNRTFYLNTSLWLFFCLCLVPVCNFVGDLSDRLEQREQEADAARTIQFIRVRQSSYAAKHRGRYALNFDELIIDRAVEGGEFDGSRLIKNGFVFQMTVVEPTSERPPFYALNVAPLDAEPGSLHFYLDSTLGPVRVTEENRPATAADTSF